MEGDDYAKKELLYEAKDELINICKLLGSKIASYYHPRFQHRPATDHVSSPKYSIKMDNTADLVTEVDRYVEFELRERLLRKFPWFGFLGEESGYTAPLKQTSTTYWIVDPIDGTTNFVHQFPNSCISIGLAQNTDAKSTTLLLGFVYHPLHDVAYWAIVNEGAFQQNIATGQLFKLCVNDSNTRLDRSLICTEFSSCEWKYKDQRSKELLTLQRTRLSYRPVHGIRCLGSAALNLVYVACGQVDLYYQYGIHAWDLAAGVLIVQEAGGIVTGLASSEFDIFSRNILACSTEELCKEFRDLVTPDESLIILKEFDPDVRPEP